MKRDFKATVAVFFRDRKRRRQRAGAVAVLSMIVVLGVVLNLVQPATTMTPKPLCGLAEHVHTDACYAMALACGMDGAEGHAHTDDCWQPVLACGMQEHVHGAALLSGHRVGPGAAALRRGY